MAAVVHLVKKQAPSNDSESLSGPSTPRGKATATAMFFGLSASGAASPGSVGFVGSQRSQKMVKAHLLEAEACLAGRSRARGQAI